MIKKTCHKDIRANFILFFLFCVALCIRDLFWLPRYDIIEVAVMFSTSNECNRLPNWFCGKVLSPDWHLHVTMSFDLLEILIFWSPIHDPQLWLAIYLWFFMKTPGHKIHLIYYFWTYDMVWEHIISDIFERKRIWWNQST